MHDVHDEEDQEGAGEEVVRLHPPTLAPSGAGQAVDRAVAAATLGRMTARGLTLALALLACAPAWSRAGDTPEVEAEVARRIREVQPLVDRGDFRAAIAALEAAPATVAASEAWAEDGARALSVCRRHLREQERFEAALAAFGAKDERPLVEWIRDVEGEGSPLGALHFVDAWRAKARAVIGPERYRKVVEQLRNDELQAMDLESPDWPDGPDDGPPPPPPAPVRGSPEHTARLAALREAGQARLEAVVAAIRSAEAATPASLALDEAFAALRAGDVAAGRAALGRARLADPALGQLDLDRLERRAQPFRPGGATELEGGGLRLTWSFDDEDELRDLAAIGDLELRAEGGALRLEHGSALVPLARVGGLWRGQLVVEAVAAVDTSLAPHRDPAPLVAVRGAAGLVVVPLLGDPSPCLLDRDGAHRLLRLQRPQSAQGGVPRQLPTVAAGQPVTVRASVRGGRLFLGVEVGAARGRDAFTTDVAWVGSALELLVGSVAPGRAAIGQLAVQGQLDPPWLERARVARRVEAVHEAEVELRWPVPAGLLPAAWGPTSAEDEAGLEGSPPAALAAVAAARTARAAGDLRAARGCLSDALGRDPLCPVALHLSAQLALERDDPEAALGFADRALKAIDGFPEAERVRAAALLALGRSKEACEALARSLEANRADPLAWLVVSDLALREDWPGGDEEHAALAFYAAVVDPLDGSRSGSPARRAAELARRLDPRSPELRRVAATRRDCSDLPGARGFPDVPPNRDGRSGSARGPRDDVWLAASGMAPGEDDAPGPSPLRRMDPDGREPPRVVFTSFPTRFFDLAVRAGLPLDPASCVLDWTRGGSVVALLRAGDGLGLAELAERTGRVARERAPALPAWAARGEAQEAADETLRHDAPPGLGLIARRNLELLAVTWPRRTPWFDLVTEARRAIPWELDGIGAAQAWLLVAAARDGVKVPTSEADAPERPLAEVYAAWRAAVTAPGFTSRRLDHAWVQTFHALDTQALDARLGAWARAQARARGIVFAD